MLIPSWEMLKAREEGESLPAEPSPVPPVGRPKRRGVTAMEYLVMISFILVVAIVGVQQFGNTTKKVMENVSNATGKTNPK